MTETLVDEGLRLQEWRVDRMVEACQGDEQVAILLLVADVDYHEVEALTEAGCPVSLLPGILA